MSGYEPEDGIQGFLILYFEPFRNLPRSGTEIGNQLYLVDFQGKLVIHLFPGILN